MPKFTKASFTSFVKKNAKSLFFKESSRFDGMYDCVVPTGKSGWYKVESIDATNKISLGINGVWLTQSSTNYFYPKYDANEKVVSVFVQNCCGSFEVANTSNV